MRTMMLVLMLAAMILAPLGGGRAEERSAGSRDGEAAVSFPSMVELLASPANFEGKRIEVTGFFGGAYTALFLTRELAEIGDYDSSILVTDETEGALEASCKGYYATLKGTFKRRLGGLLGTDPENFEIDDVTEVRVLKDGKETTCWRKR